jgi:murein DD-endopeptidase MepM/ murein hydrolase activator NlpD
VLPHQVLASVALTVTLTPTPEVPGVPDPVGSWPLRPRPPVASGFDPPDSAWGPGHRGVDLLGRPGQPVHAALAGTVSFSGVIAGRPVVVVDHGPTRTTYEPVSSSLSPGDRVPEGARVGVLQLVGSHCLPQACLHWGWLRGETYLDPLGLVGAGPVRLLPLDGLATQTPIQSPFARWASPAETWWRVARWW